MLLSTVVTLNNFSSWEMSHDYAVVSLICLLSTLTKAFDELLVQVTICDFKLHSRQFLAPLEIDDLRCRVADH